MRHIFSLYPSGAAGAGLLLLRLHAVLLLLELATTGPPVVALGVGVLSAAVALGLHARVATLLSVAALSGAMLVGIHPPHLLIASQLCGLLALALLGPGAFSVDARRFGRKVIRLP